MLILLMFMYIFAFKIYSIIDSSIIVGIYLFIFMLKNTKYKKKIFANLKNKYFLTLFVGMLLVLIWSMLTLVFNNSFDLTYIKTLIHLYINLGIGYALFFYYDYKNRKYDIVNHILVVFLIQSCLQWFFFLFPSISKLFNIFRTQSMILNNLKYAGYRGLAISSTGFFGLSSAYGLISIIYFIKYNTLFKNNMLKYMIFLLLYSGTFFAGRTGFVALPFFLILIFLDIKKQNKKKEENKKNIKQIGIVLLVFLSLILLTTRIPKFAKMYNYTFELVKNVFSGNGFFTTSTDKMFDMYDVEISPKTFLIGDGKYTVLVNGEQKYYRRTDIGYLRKILYFGIIGTLLSFLFEVFIFNKKLKKEHLLLFIFLMVLELKGEIIGISILLNSILLLYNMQELFPSEKNKGDITRKKTNMETKNKPLVSIIMPVYNSSNYLIETIDSILNQTYDNFELIIVDDGSTDGSKDILNEKYSNNKKIKIFYQKNLGAPTARNTGFKKSKGELIMFFDSDDCMDKKYLEEALKNYDNEDLIIANFRRFSSKNSKLSEEIYKENKDLNFEENLYLISPFPGNKIYKREIIEKNNICFDNLKMAQDLNFYIKYLQYTKNVRIIEDIYIYYRIHEKSISTTYNMNLLDVEKSITLATKNISENKIYLARMLKIKHYTTQLLKLNNYSLDDAKKIRSYYRKSAIKNKIYKIEWKYKKYMGNYILYQIFVFLMPIKVIKVINEKIKGSMNHGN